MFFKRTYSLYKAFNEIPGPKQFPVVGNALLFSPFGKYKMEDLVSGFSDLQIQYGNIVRLKLGQEVVLIFNPNDIQELYQHEGKYPNRPTFDALKKCRKEKYNCIGIVPDNGPEWYRLRKVIVGILNLKTVHSYWSTQSKIAQEFAHSLMIQSDPDGIFDDFMPFAFLYSLEAIGALCYGRRLGCISSNSKEGQQIASMNVEFLKALGETFHNPPWWKLWPTAPYKKLENTQDFMMKITEKYLLDARMLISETQSTFPKENPFLCGLLSDSSVSETETRVLITELFQGGIDATATTITMMLHELAKNPLVQEAVYVDLKENDLKPGHIPSLLRACLKETLRMYPTASANSRIINSDAVFSGYLVPKGTLVIGVNPVTSRMEDYFKNPAKFDPWRWLSSDHKIHPYSVIPFGHGARMCPGRRFAEQEIFLCVGEILKKYKVLSFNTRDIYMKLATNLVPADKIKLGFLSRL